MVNKKNLDCWLNKMRHWETSPWTPLIKKIICRLIDSENNRWLQLSSPRVNILIIFNEWKLNVSPAGSDQQKWNIQRVGSSDKTSQITDTKKNFCRLLLNLWYFKSGFVQRLWCRPCCIGANPAGVHFLWQTVHLRLFGGDSTLPPPVSH